MIPHSSFFNPQTLLTTLLTLLALLLLSFINSYLIQARRRLRFYEQQGFKVDYFYPMLGFFLKLRRQHEKKYGEPYYAMLQALRSNPSKKFYLTNIMDRPLLYLFDREMIKEFLFDKVHHYEKFFYVKAFKRSLGDGLIFSSGDTWRRHRRIASAAFDYNYVEKMMPFLLETAQEHFSALKAKLRASDGKLTINVLDEFQFITGNAVLRTFFGEDVMNKELDGQPMTVTLGKLTVEVYKQALSPFLSWFGPKFFDIGLRKRDRWINATIREFRTFAADVIAKRKENLIAVYKADGARKDLLQILLENNLNKTSEHKDFLSDREITDMFLSFFAAGMDTTGHLLALTVSNLWTHPECLKKSEEEVKVSGELRSAGDLKSLRYLKAVLEETLRITGPASALFLREAQVDHELAGVKIKKGSIVNIMIRTNNMRGDYDDDMEFKPERFLGDQMTKLKPFSYIPFSSGPRNCLGQHLAMMEAICVLAEFLRTFNFSLDPDHKLNLTITPLTAPSRPILATLTDRVRT